MNTKKIIEIHEINSEIIKKIVDLDLQNCILTFDDGLQSQWKYIDDLVALDVPKYFFISTDIVCEKHSEQSTEFISCSEAHKKAFKNNKENYMTWSQIKVISKLPNCNIGGHSDRHQLYQISPLKDLYKNLIDDTKNMLKKFKDNNIKIDSFCFPYNEDYDDLYKIIVIKEGLCETYGRGRIKIEEIE